jgi:thiamine biosynthesis lipoprotein
MNNSKKMQLPNSSFSFLIVLCLALLTGGCGTGPKDHRETLYVFGTLVEIQAYTNDSKGFSKAVAELDKMFQKMHRDWHSWQGEGELIRLNRALAQGDTVTISEELVDLLKRGNTYSDQSDKLFNPAIGMLIKLWGFHHDELPAGPPPAEATIQRLVAQSPTMDSLKFADDGSVRSVNPTVQIDLGAYAKGVALNLAVDHLRKAGIQDAIVNAGGDLCVSGRHGTRAWNIGIRNPFKKGVVASLDVKGGECVLTSGNYERYRQHNGIKYAHIIDPRTGYPVTHVASATVVHPDGGLADAAATALSVAGPENWRKIAQQMSLNQVMLVDESGTIHLTDELRSRIQLLETPKP